MKLRIAYCVSHFPYQSETYLLNQLKELLEEGHEVTIFSIGQFDTYPKHAVIEKYKLLERTIYRPPIPKGRFKRLAVAFKLLLQNIPHAKHLLRTLNVARYGTYALNLQFFYDAIPFLRKKEFDIVHCQFGPNGIKALNFREIGLLNGALITSFHGFDINEKEFLSWPEHYSRKGLYRDLNQACHIFTVSSRFSRHTAASLGIAAGKIEVLPAGLDTQKFRRREQGTRKNSSPFILLTVARLVDVKGIAYGIRAVSTLVQEFPNLLYHVIGEGEKRAELEELINSLNLQNHICLHGAATQEEVLEHYQMADVFVLTGVEAADGEVETQGLVVQEAQSMELPVVVTDAGGTAEGVLEGITGFVVPQKDVTAIVEKIRYLLENPEERNRLGKAGRAFVVEQYDAKVQHRRLMELYHRLLRQEA
ncbi:glycosyltransferase [Pontibacter sp. E15-1]|uniref:glycosyltransferase n=1 Tax=Pontibacter sp. E15-1 TaxID=2919918 RepID=UPI001F4F49CF|nr:glycosyltransferase [Pontibacter sp. E15-1]MCJ8164008.1 glycosyltransferase [Pontibacter sp. E15-1]